MEKLNQEFKFVDYSQYSTWMKCPRAWWERYVQRTTKDWGTRQRDDAMCIGSLYHNGMENWYKHGIVKVDPEVIDEVNPTSEVMGLVTGLLNGYIQRYPSTQWEIQRIEAPLTKRLVDDIHLLAKVDQYFYVPELVMIESGIPGERLTLNKGYYVFEHKTKAMGVNRGFYMQRWTTNMQADFQLIALRAHLEKLGIDEPVHGVLINVVEKPKDRVPQRTCKQCKAKLDITSYQPSVEVGESCCPLCGFSQKLSPLKSDSIGGQPEFYRLLATRTENQLYKSEHAIKMLAEKMDNLKDANKHQLGFDFFEIENRERCVDTIFGPCEYYDAHVYGLDAKDADGFVQIDTTKYVGLEQVAA